MDTLARAWVMDKALNLRSVRVQYHNIPPQTSVRNTDAQSVQSVSIKVITAIDPN